MSAKLSSASPASAGASITAAKAAAPEAAAAAAGNGTCDGVGAAAGPLGSSGAGAGPGSGPGSSARFTSAMADAAKADDRAAIAQIRDGKQPTAAGTADGGERIDTSGGANNASGTRGGADQRSRDKTAADVTQGANATIVAGAHDNGANAAKSNVAVPGQPGNARDGVTRAKSGGARAPGGGDTSALTTDPVALAMLLAASGMQMNGSAGASTAIDGSGSAAENAAAGRKPAMAAPATADALSLALSADGLPATPTPSQGKTENFDSSAGQPASMTGSAGLPELVRGFATTATLSPVVEATISVPLASGAWPHAIAAQVHWFVNNDVQSATLRLSPEHLGPVEVHIDVRNSEVNVNFSAAHAETRVALEQTVPQLREIFASAGLTLGQASVQQDPRPGSHPSAVAVRSAFAQAQAVEPVAVAAAHGFGLVDEYA